MAFGNALLWLGASHTAGSVSLCLAPSSTSRQCLGLCAEAIIIYSLINQTYYTHVEWINSYIGWYQAGLLFHFNFLLNIAKYQPYPEQSHMDRCKQSFYQLWNPRGINTDWPHRNKSRKVKPIPSQEKLFVLQRVLGAAFSLLVLYAWNDGANAPKFFVLEDLSPEKQHLLPRLREVTWKELQARVALTVICQAHDYAFITWLHSVLSVFGVVIFGHDPEDWPPLFGDITEAYTVRRAWT